MATGRRRLKTQISFYCTREFANALRAEKVRRGMTIQQLITHAMQEYMMRPPSSENHTDLDKNDSVLVRDVRRAWIGLCDKYFATMPEPKLELLKEFMLVDLKHYKSSRLKRKSS